MSEEKEKLEKRVNDFTYKVLDRAIKYRGKYEARRCAWIIEDLVRRKGQSDDAISKNLKANGDKDLLNEWEELKNDLRIPSGEKK